MNIYLDESGDSTGFTKTGSSTTFNIALLKIDDSQSLKRVVKSFYKKMHKHGWPKRLELKAYHLFNCRKISQVSDKFKYKYKSASIIIEFLSKLSSLDIEVDFISVFKENVHASLKNAPAFIFYNYLAGRLIEENAKKYSNITLFYDVKNKETKPKLKFDSYIITRAYTAAAESNPQRNFSIALKPCDSKDSYGIKAVDFVSWSIFRKHEYNDPRFYDVFTHKIGSSQQWFYK